MAELTDEQVTGLLEDIRKWGIKTESGRHAEAVLQLNKKESVKSQGGSIYQNDRETIDRLRFIAKKNDGHYAVTIHLNGVAAKAILTVCGYDIEEPEPEKMEVVKFGAQGGYIEESCDGVKLVMPGNRTESYQLNAVHEFIGKKIAKNKAARK